MNAYRISLQHDYAASFFEEALHPSVAELRQRDAFLEELDTAIPNEIIGTNIVAEIPDIELPFGDVQREVYYPPVKINREEFVVPMEAVHRRVPRTPHILTGLDTNNGDLYRISSPRKTSAA